MSSREERFGSWRLVALIDAGGLGEVWRAEHSSPEAGLHGSMTRGRPDTVAALKRLHTHLVSVPEARALFATEQRLATELPRHPGVVHALDAGDVAGRPYLAMELAPGADLRRLLGAPLPRSRALALVAAACDAAAHLHAHGWVHGDLSPGNLIVDADRVVLVDLGVARPTGTGGPVRGSHAYMAPEQVRGAAWTPALDVFALGVLLWELVAGARLFHRGSPWLSQAAVVEAAPPPLLDPALDAIAQAALAKDPARRIASASELAALLRGR